MWAIVVIALAMGASAQTVTPVKWLSPTDFAPLNEETLENDCSGACCIGAPINGPPVICNARLVEDGLVLYPQPGTPVEPCVDLVSSFFFATDIDYLYEAASFLVEKRQEIAGSTPVDEYDFCSAPAKFRAKDVCDVHCDSSVQIPGGQGLSVETLLDEVNTCLDDLLNAMFPIIPGEPNPDEDTYDDLVECDEGPPGLVGYDVEVACQVLQGSSPCCRCRCSPSRPNIRRCPAVRCCVKKRPKIKKPKISAYCKSIS